VLIDLKYMLRVGDTVVPLIFMTEESQLVNLAGAMEEWPVYMTFGNLS